MSFVSPEKNPIIGYPLKNTNEGWVSEKGDYKLPETINPTDEYTLENSTVSAISKVATTQKLNKPTTVISAERNNTNEYIVTTPYSIPTPPLPETDPYWANVISLLHFENGMYDETGNIWENTYPYAPYRRQIIGGVNPQFNGAGVFGKGITGNDTNKPNERYLLPFSSLAASEDFTLEMYIDAFSFSTGSFINIATIENDVPQSDVSLLRLLLSRDTGANAFSISAVIINANPAWGEPSEVFLDFEYYRPSASLDLRGQHNVAISKSGATTRLLIDGIERASTNIQTKALAFPCLYLACNRYANMNAIIMDELRFTKSVGRYTEDFIVRNTPFPNM